MKFHELYKSLLHNRVHRCLHCDSILLTWIILKAKQYFPWIIIIKKKSWNLWGADLLSNLQWLVGSASVTVRVKRFIYPWHRWCCAGLLPRPDLCSNAHWSWILRPCTQSCPDRIFRAGWHTSKNRIQYCCTLRIEEKPVYGGPRPVRQQEMRQLVSCHCWHDSLFFWW